MVYKPKHPGGRPPVARQALELGVNLDIVRRGAFIGCTTEEIATLLGIGRSTLYGFIAKNQKVQEAIDEGRDQGRATLRRFQWQGAEAGNPAMLIWLGKQILGQTDQSKVTLDGKLTLEGLVQQAAAKKEGAE